jgi:hypothetical protein
VNDGIAGKIIHGGHEAILEFLLGCDADVAQDGTGSHIMAAPITYAVNGVQYVGVQVGYGGTNIAGYTIPPSSAASKYENVNRIIAFKLDGGNVPAPPALVNLPFPKPPEAHSSPAQLTLGVTQEAAKIGIQF